MIEQTNADEAVHALFKGTTPERLEAVVELLESTQYEIAHDRPALHLEATGFFGKGIVVLTNRTMQQIWLIAYLSWHTLHEQSGFIIVPLAQNQPYDVKLLSKNDQHIAFVDRLGQALIELRTAEAGNNAWPADVPQLDPKLSQLRDREDHAAYDLGCLAAAFVLLHETHHAQKRAQGEAYEGIDEELACDRFAINFLLAESDRYAELNSYEPIRVYRKRAMGIFLGLAVAFESTELGLWLPSETHPSAYGRIKQLIDIVEPRIAEPNDDFWIFACCMLLSKFRRHQRLPETIHFDSSRDLFCKVSEVMKPE